MQVFRILWHALFQILLVLPLFDGNEVRGSTSSSGDQTVTTVGVTDAPIVGTTSVSLEDAHICTRHVFKAAYRYIPVQQNCWQPHLVACQTQDTNSTAGSPVAEESRSPRNDSVGASECDGCSEPCYEYRATPCTRYEMRCILEDALEYFCCPGYDNVSGRCVLVQECYENNGNCEQLCHHNNKNGGSYCGCFPGYHLKNRTHCLETDECQVKNGGCSDKCKNVPGTYFCSCKSGYGLVDTKTCTEIDECEIGNGGCEHHCVNTPGTYYCVCNSGYKLLKGYACKDWNECDSFNGGCSHFCYNYDGGYQCICPSNMMLDSDNRTCYTPTSTTIHTSTKSTKFREPLAPRWTKPTSFFIPGRTEPLTSNSKQTMSLEVLIVPLVVLTVLTALGLLAALFVRRKRGKPPQENHESTENIHYDVTLQPVMGSLNGNRMPLFLAFNNDAYSRETSQQI